MVFFPASILGVCVMYFHPDAILEYNLKNSILYDLQFLRKKILRNKKSDLKPGKSIFIFNYLK